MTNTEFEKQIEKKIQCLTNYEYGNMSRNDAKLLVTATAIGLKSFFVEYMEGLIGEDEKFKHGVNSVAEGDACSDCTAVRHANWVLSNLREKLEELK